jgi:hypothetical protein
VEEAREDEDDQMLHVFVWKKIEEKTRSEVRGQRLIPYLALSIYFRMTDLFKRNHHHDHTHMQEQTQRL